MLYGTIHNNTEMLTYFLGGWFTCDTPTETNGTNDS
jgi:hypothetical protein